MRHWKSSILAATILAGLATSSASAQQFAVGGGAGNAFGINNGFAGGGFTNFGGFNSGFNNFGNNNFGYNNYNYSYPQTYNNMGGLMGTIRTQTGRGNSYRSGYGPAVGGRRR